MFILQLQCKQKELAEDKLITEQLEQLEREKVI